MSNSSSRGFTLAQWTFTFVPFGVLLAAALLVPEMLTPGGTPKLHWLDHALGLDNPAGRPVPPGTPLLALLRAILCIWLSTALLIPAACLYILRDKSDTRKRYALLWWTFSYLAYMVHFYYTAFVIFGGVAGTFANMRWWVAATNFLLTAWWTVDVLIAWYAEPEQKSIRWERRLALAFIVLVYVVTDLFLRPTIVRYLGAALAASVLLCLLVRLSQGGFRESPQRKESVVSPIARLSTPRFWFVFILFAVLIGAAHVAAERRATKDAELAAALQDRAADPWKGQQGEFPAPHTVVYYRIVFTIWVATILLTVALCFYALRRPSAPSNYWVLFWTFAYLAYLLHFYWSVGVLFGWDFTSKDGILHSRIGVNPDPEKVVCNPIPDLVLTVWWGLDVLLAWLVFGRSCPKWLRIERGAVSLFAFAAFFGATVLAAKAGPVVRVLGVLMLLSVLFCYVLRIIMRPLEPGSLAAFLYVGFFRLLNLFRPWYRLPTFLGVMNLAALREVLRAHNLHSTSKELDGRETIPVTNPAAAASLRLSTPPCSASGRQTATTMTSTIRRWAAAANRIQPPHCRAAFSAAIPAHASAETCPSRMLTRSRSPNYFNQARARSAAPAARTPPSNRRRSSIISRQLGFSSRRTTGSSTATPLRAESSKSILRRAILGVRVPCLSAALRRTQRAIRATGRGRRLTSTPSPTGGTPRRYMAMTPPQWRNCGAIRAAIRCRTAGSM